MIDHPPKAKRTRRPMAVTKTPARRFITMHACLSSIVRQHEGVLAACVVDGSTEIAILATHGATISEPALVVVSTFIRSMLAAASCEVVDATFEPREAGYDSEERDVVGRMRIVAAVLPRPNGPTIGAVAIVTTPGNTACKSLRRLVRQVRGQYLAIATATDGGEG
jgi:hypothetical protein